MNGDGGTASQVNGEVPRWKQLATTHRHKQLSLIPAEWRVEKVPAPNDQRNATPFIEKHLSAKELDITALSQTLPDLQRAIWKGAYSAAEITSAFSHRAALLQQLTGCLTEILFSSAQDTAKKQDAENSANSQRSPLYGIPISIKDNQDIQGVDSTLGWVGLINKPAKQSAPCVETVVKAGGILYCKTNIPQSMMMSDSYNHVYGQSVNSLNRNLISGGSSGGEAALIAGGGSICGVGTDIGGSVRIPATLQGLYGLSPSTGRFGSRESPRRDKYVVSPVAGPLARDIETLDVFMDSYLSVSPWLDDPGLLPMPWRRDLVGTYATAEKLKVGFMIDDGVVRCQPAVVRAVEHSTDLLKKAGHEIVDFNGIAQKYHAKAYDLWLRAVLADGGERFQALCDLVDEPLIPGMLVGKPENKLDVNGRMALYDEIWEFQKEYMRVWNESGINVLVMPVTQWVGLRPKMWVKASMYVGYTSIWNLMNWSALAVPSIKFDAEIDAPNEEWKAYQGRSFSDSFNHKSYEELFDEFVGMPVGVQLVTGKLEEEKAVGIAKLLASLSKNH